MKKNIYTLFLLLVVVGGLVFTNHEIIDKTSKKPIPKPLGGTPLGGTPLGGTPLGSTPPSGVPLSAAARKAELKRWEATPDGVKFKKWEASPAGKKVYASEAKIRKQISDSTNMEAVVTSLSLPTGSRLGFGVMVRINGDDYILAFGSGKSNEFQQLHTLKVNGKIIIKSHSVMHAPKYSYPIIAADYVERNSKVIYKRVPRKGGC